MNNQLWGMLNATEQQLVRETEASALVDLDEDSLAALHDRVRKARNKYTKLYRRRASAQVGRDSARAKAHAQHSRTAAKAEVFEDMLARVSSHLARAARASARELRTERLDAARRTSTARPKAKAKPRRGATTASDRAKTKRNTPATKRARAATRATTARKQAKRDSR